MSSILVVGGAGYIGAHIVDLLCDNDCNVIVLDNLSSGYRENINENAKFVLGDICNKSDLRNILKNNKIESVIHMAAFKSVGVSNKKSNIYTQNNIIGSLNLISACVEFNIEQFIFSSTAAVYGDPLYNPIDEKHPINPINHYGFTKSYIENYLEWISTIKSIKFITLRYFNAAGYTAKKDLIKHKEKMPENLLPIIMEVATGEREILQVFGNDYDTVDGTCIRDYIHVLDLARAHIDALNYLKKYKKNSVVNLSTGKGTSVLEVIKIAENYTSRKINYDFMDRRLGDPGTLISQYSKANNLFGWMPKYSMEDIVSSMWEMYR
mgnify:CR=1 FL=1